MKVFQVGLSARGTLLKVLLALFICSLFSCSKRGGNARHAADGCAYELEGSNLVFRLGQDIQFKCLPVPPGSGFMGQDDIFDQKSLRGFINTGGEIESPMTRTSFSNMFYMAESKVTNRNFIHFLSSVGGTLDERLSYLQLEHDNNQYYPVYYSHDKGGFVCREGCLDAIANNISWRGAIAYCNWLSRCSGLSVSLPTRAEWEYAMRGPSGLALPDRRQRESDWETIRAQEKMSHCLGLDSLNQTVSPFGHLGAIDGPPEYVFRDTLDREQSKVGSEHTRKKFILMWSASKRRMTEYYMLDMNSTALRGWEFGLRIVVHF